MTYRINNDKGIEFIKGNTNILKIGDTLCNEL